MRELDGGGRQLLPERPNALVMRDAMDTLDLFTVFRRAICPLLIVRALHRVPPAPGLEWMDEPMDAYGRGLARNPAELVTQRPRIAAEGIAATPAMLPQAPVRMAELVRGFTAGP